jgi:hypothetical protein
LKLTLSLIIIKKIKDDNAFVFVGIGSTFPKMKANTLKTSKKEERLEERKGRQQLPLLGETWGGGGEWWWINDKNVS